MAQEWDNPAIFNINKLPAHATATIFPDIQSALAGNMEHSPYYKLLNGNWKFNWSENPAISLSAFMRRNMI
ncbi:MAG: hypothetical protein HC896_18120 [Bacteroidales bacterium]|nr:hypothetical protein [Bacteroidales bacterium]